MLFTKTLELKVINPIFADIAFNRLSWFVEKSFCVQAFEFYLEEAEHAKCSDDLMSEIFPLYHQQAFSSDLLEKIEMLRNKHDLIDPKWFDFVCFVSSECLISQNLVTLATDNNLDIRVRQYVAEHAKDESKHRRFCLELIKTISIQWSSSFKEQFISLARDFALVFLSPDQRLLEQLLGRPIVIKSKTEENLLVTNRLQQTLEGCLS